jgi:hypothetical protein
LIRFVSSNAVEATFSHVRLKGGSNDMTDSRTPEYALRQILRCRIVKALKSSSIAQNTDYTTVNTILPNSSETNVNHEDLILPFQLRIQIQNLSKYFFCPNRIFGRICY